MFLPKTQERFLGTGGIHSYPKKTEFKATKNLATVIETWKEPEEFLGKPIPNDPIKHLGAGWDVW